MQFYSKFLFDSLRSNINYEINVIANSVLWRFTPGPLYSTLHYNTVLDITLIIVGPQLDYIWYMSIHFTLVLIQIG